MKDFGFWSIFLRVLQHSTLPHLAKLPFISDNSLLLPKTIQFVSELLDRVIHLNIYALPSNQTKLTSNQIKRRLLYPIV